MESELAILPFIDEHRVLVNARPHEVWESLGMTLHRYPELLLAVAASLLGAQARRTHGDVFTEGATLPGFTVRQVRPNSRLILAGRHRFSDYMLTFTLQEAQGRTVLAAESHADFLGWPGRIYRGLVVGTGGHRVLVTRLLHSVRDACETQAYRRG